MTSNVELHELRVFLTLSEELHFGRTAERLGLSSSRVSQIVRGLERKLGGQLLYRTSRRVELTALGEKLRERLVPTHAALVAALDDVKRAATAPLGLLRIGFTQTTEARATALAADFELRHADYRVDLREVGLSDIHGPLRRNEIDVLVNWLVVDEAGLTVGPTIARLPRMLAVSTSHPLAKRESVSIEDVADYQVRPKPGGFPQALFDVIVPPRTPSGRPIPRVSQASTTSMWEIIADVARGAVVHPTVAVPLFRGHDSIVLVPIHDLPPLPLGLIWLTANESAHIRTLAEFAAGRKDR
jgi:DNA-binding transcriptional LysR family regulator